MKALIAFGSLLLIASTSVFAADGNVAGPTLAKMGLGGMKMISDEQGMHVRGMAFVKVSGWSVARNSSVTKIDGYFVVGNHSVADSASSIVFSGLRISGAAGGARASAR